MASPVEQDSVLRMLDTVVADGSARRGAAKESPSKSARWKPTHPAKRKTSARKSRSQIEVLRVPAWSGDPKLGWLIHGFSTRTGGKTVVYRPAVKQHEADQEADHEAAHDEPNGDLNLGFTASDDRQVVEANRKLFVKAVCGGRRSLPLITLRQIHSSLSHRITPAAFPEDQSEPVILKADGLMTDQPGVLLGIQTADCIPILVADKKNRAVAAFHAGWRGTLARIVEKGIGRMRLEFGSRPENMVAAIGPGIGQCCYSVGEEVRQEFESQFAYAAELFREISDSDPVKEKYPMLFLTARAPGHSNLDPSLHLNLAEANRRQLLAAGLKAGSIHLTDECTGCQPDRFFSNRMEHGFTGRLMSVIGIRPQLS